MTTEALKLKPGSLPKNTKLTPRLKRVYVEASALIRKGWEKGYWMTDTKGIQHAEGWANGTVKPKTVCAVGGLQRAAWIVSGKPDMSIPENQQSVNALARTAELRADAFARSFGEQRWPEEDVRFSLMELNDHEPSKKKDVLAVIAAAGNLA